MHDISSAYSCLLYLKSELSKDNNVFLWAFTKKEKIQSEHKNNYYSFRDTWYGNIRRFRIYCSKIKMYKVAKVYDIVIINDLDFFRMGYLLKKKYPKKIIIHYNTEIHGEDVKYAWHTERFYEKHSSYPDLIIECLQERAEYRKNKYNISKEIYVVNNTVPQKEIESIDENTLDYDLYFNFERQLPIVVYAGGCDFSRSLGDVIEAASHNIFNFNFLFFCHGNQNDLEVVKKMCEKYSNCKVFEAVPRVVLFQIMKYCNIGIQYYEPNFSVNHLYAAPSKFFEYISLGLKVVSSNNIGVNRMIEEDNLGVCIADGEKIEDALYKIKNSDETEKLRIRKVFKEKYSYEVDSRLAIRAIREKILEL